MRHILLNSLIIWSSVSLYTYRYIHVESHTITSKRHVYIWFCTCSILTFSNTHVIWDTHSFPAQKWANNAKPQTHVLLREVEPCMLSYLPTSCVCMLFSIVAFIPRWCAPTYLSQSSWHLPTDAWVLHRTWIAAVSKYWYIFRTKPNPEIKNLKHVK